MPTRRNALRTTIGLGLTFVLKVAGSKADLLPEGDTDWGVSSFRDLLIRRVGEFFGDTQGMLLYAGDTAQKVKTKRLFDQFVNVFGYHRPLEVLPDGRWAFSATAPRMPAYIAYVITAQDQTTIDAIMMSHNLCPAGGVQSRELDGVAVRHLCEEDPGWSIFVKVVQQENQELFKELAAVAMHYRMITQASFVREEIRTKDSIQAKTMVYVLP